MLYSNSCCLHCAKNCIASCMLIERCCWASLLSFLWRPDIYSWLSECFYVNYFLQWVILCKEFVCYSNHIWMHFLSYHYFSPQYIHHLLWENSLFCPGDHGQLFKQYHPNKLYTAVANVINMHTAWYEQLESTVMEEIKFCSYSTDSYLWFIYICIYKAFLIHGWYNIYRSQ